MWPSFIIMLTWWQWLILAAVPPAIIALYFLKLKRRPLEVPSTYLWHKSIEDLHVNSVWQRLRRNLLLFLQLLLVFLAMMALLRPNWRGVELTGERFIFLIDNSASMQATDVEPSRLEEAKRKAGELIGQMKSGDVAMIVSFADSARVVQTFTDDRRLLRRRLESIQPTQRSTSLLEALKVASGLANPGHTAEEDDEFRVAEALPADLYIFSDGKFAPAEGFSLGNLRLESPQSRTGGRFVPIGKPEAANVAVTAFSVQRHEQKPDQLQAFARLEYFAPFMFSLGLEYQSDLEEGKLSQAFFQEFATRSSSLSGQATVVPERAGEQWRVSDHRQSYLVRKNKVLRVYGPANVSVSVELLLDGQSTDFDQVEVAAGKGRGVTFDLGAVESGRLELKVTTEDDHLAIDDTAYTVVSPPRRAAVLLVTPGNEPLELALQTDSAMEIAQLQTESPEFLERKEYRERASGGGYDLVIYDRCRPKELPQANTFFIGSLPPPETGWSATPAAGPFQIADFEPTHPLLHWMGLGDVILVEGSAVKPPSGGSVLADASSADADTVPVLAIAPRKRFEDAVLGFAIIAEEPGAGGVKYRNTNWPTLQSFPVFVRNLLNYLGGSRAALESGSVRPGKPVTLEAPTPQAGLQVRRVNPPGEPVELTGGKSGKFDFTGTDELGVYEVQSGGETFQQFAVNLFDPTESDVRPEPEPSIQIGYVEVSGQPGWDTASREIWKWLLLFGLAVLLLEWYIYNRRVYV